MKLILIALFILDVSWAKNLSAREEALSLFPEKLRQVLSYNSEQIKKVIDAIDAQSKHETKETIFINVYGVNYDVTLGKAGKTLAWMSLMAPPKHAPGLYERLLEQMSKSDQKKIIQERTVTRGNSKQHYLDFNFKSEGVILRFNLSNKELFSVVVRKSP